MKEIFSNPAFWSKFASEQNADRPPTVDDAVQVLGGFFGAMKEAGLNDEQTLGFVLGVMEVEGMDKEAGTFVDTVYQMFNPKRWGSGDGVTSGNFGAGAGGWSDLVPGVAAYKRVVQNNAAHLLNPKTDLTAGMANMQQNYSGPLGNITDKIKQDHGMAFPIMKELHNGDEGAAVKNILQFGRGEYGDALGSAGSALMAHPMIKQIAPYAVPALATFATTKLLGGGTGTALGLGAIAGGIGGGTDWGRNLQTSATNKVKEWMTPPAATTPPPAGGAPKTEPVKTTAITPAMQQTHEHADQIGKQPLQQPIHPAAQVA